jgi:maltodextrin utilization protein YvdJ
LSISATALSLNLRYEPSFLPTHFFVLTITALATSPFLKVDVVETLLIAITTLSPIVAFLPFDHFKTLMICPVFAPVLSAIITPDSFCNMVVKL